MLAVAEALGYLEQPQSSIAALRIGTTEEIFSIECAKTSGGKITMAAPVVEFMMRGQAQSASGMALHVLGKDRYHEINPKAAQGDFKIDKLSEELVALADAEWRHQSSELLDKGFLNHTAAAFEPCHKI